MYGYVCIFIGNYFSTMCLVYFSIMILTFGGVCVGGRVFFEQYRFWLIKCFLVFRQFKNVLVWERFVRKFRFFGKVFQDKWVVVKRKVVQFGGYVVFRDGCRSLKLFSFYLVIDIFWVISFFSKGILGNFWQRGVFFYVDILKIFFRIILFFNFDVMCMFRVGLVGQ